VKFRGGHMSRRILFAGFGSIAAALLVASLSWACTPQAGQTYFSDGSTSKTVSRGTTITANGIGGTQGIPYHLVIGRSEGGHAAHGCMTIVFTVNGTDTFANSAGIVPDRSGPAGNASTPAGNYELCFRDKDTSLNRGATGPASITLI